LDQRKKSGVGRECLTTAVEKSSGENSKKEERKVGGNMPKEWVTASLVKAVADKRKTAKTIAF